MAGFLLVFECVFVVIFSLPNCGQATRFLPMIVWDHINPMLKCKINWLTNIPKIDEYDRVDFMCPSLKVAVKLLDGYSRPKSEMNENIFRRKWEGNNLTELGNALRNDSFCSISKSKKEYSCEDGEEGKSLTVTFKQGNGYKIGDIVVFFNNADDGKASSLASKAVECSMVLVINITKAAKVKHDISYGKQLNPNDDTCDCTNITDMTECNDPPPSTSPPPCTTSPPPSTTSPPPSTTSPPPSTTSPPPSTTSPPPSTTSPPTLNSSSNPSSKPPTTSSECSTKQETIATCTPCPSSNCTRVLKRSSGNGSNNKWSVEMFFIGFIVGVGILGCVVLICYLYLRKKPQKTKVYIEKVVTIQNSTPGPGYPNKAFQLQTLPKVEIKETIEIVSPLDCPDGQSRQEKMG